LSAWDTTDGLVGVAFGSKILLIFNCEDIVLFAVNAVEYFIFEAH
jgi:uncharacterized membrane protein